MKHIKILIIAAMAIFVSSCNKNSDKDVEPTPVVKKTKFSEIFTDWTGRTLKGIEKNGDLLCTGYGTGDDSAVGTMYMSGWTYKISAVYDSPLKYNTDSIYGDVYRIIIRSQSGATLYGNLSNYQNKKDGVPFGRMFRVLYVSGASVTPGGKYVDSL